MGSNFDEFMFMAIKESRSIEDILEKFFSFLRRHTDFCHTMMSDDEISKLGLDNSVNSRGFKHNQMINLVNRIIEDNFKIYRKDHQPYLLNNFSCNNLTINNQRESSKVDLKNSKSNDSKIPNFHKDSINKDKPSHSQLKYTINPWNGAFTKKYAWSQTFREITIEVLSDEKLTPKEVKVNISRDKMTLNISGRLIIDGEFCHKVNSSESVWSIEDGCRILISLEKSEELWWDCVIKGDETIDTQQIESTKRLDEFSESEQSAILKLMNDHKNKM